MCRLLVLLLMIMLTIPPFSGKAQFNYTIDQSIPVVGSNKVVLRNPWAGGLNATQFNTMDLDGDAKDDLVLFDRMANRIITFLNVKDKWTYAPEYEAEFPADVTNWILLKDFNCDGKKDIFTGDPFGAKVYQNVSTEKGRSNWKRFMFSGQGGTRSDILLTKGFTTKTNLQLQYDDLPTIVDADNDGDLDIFNVRFTGNGSVEYHKNLSFERYGVCDSLDFERQTQVWGAFTQCKCERFAYNDTDCPFSSGRIQHAGGKALLAIDLDNDGDHELLFSESECRNIYALPNEGTISQPSINYNFAFPPSRPVDINIFPAAFYEDVDMDGLRDLIATPNMYRKDIASQDLSASTWLYKNTGTASIPNFTFVKSNFLQDQMIDVGDDAVPAFMDIDGDTDLDLFVSNNSDATASGSVHFYRNIGNNEAPEFMFESDDFIELKALLLTNIRIQFADLSSDGKPDLCFMGVDKQGRARIYYVVNRSGESAFNLQDLASLNFDITVQDNFHFTDVNHDGSVDLLLLKAVGSLEYWQNTGPKGFPAFSVQDRAYLGFGPSTSRRLFSVHAADLDNDERIDLIVVDQFGGLTIIKDYHGSQVFTTITDIAYNPLLAEYKQPSFGKGWASTADLFGSSRPAIIVGNVRGGINILRNEEKDLTFKDLALKVYPNPAGTSGNVVIETNLSLNLDVYNVLGQVIQRSIPISFGMNEIPLSSFSPGLYILKLSDGVNTVSRRLVVN